MERGRTKSSTLRKRILDGQPVQVMGAHDALGAKLAEEAGFDAIWASGLEISASAGVPDANILTMTEFLNSAIEINQGTKLPVICDCDTGFGNSNNVIHLVRRYEAAGLAAICIEDKQFPKVNSYIAGRQDLASVSEFVGKIMAAKHAQDNDDFVVIGRIEALIAGQGEAEALRRAEAYLNAGADVILIHSKAKTPDEVLSFLRQWERRSPVAIVPTSYPSLSASEWAEAGAKIVIYANQGMRAAIHAMGEVFHEIRETGSTRSVEERIAPMRRVFELQGMPAMKEDEKRFLTSESVPTRALIPAGGDLSLPEDLRAIVGREVPRALLDIYGKPLVQRQTEVFARAGISDVTLVAPIDPRRHDLGDLKLVQHEGKGILSSIRAGLEMLKGEPSRVVVSYSDILFSDGVLNALLTSEDPINIVVSRFAEDGAASSSSSKQSLDRVIVDSLPETGKRSLEATPRASVQKIGKKLPPSSSHYEFIGLMSLSVEGLRGFLQRCDELEKQFKGRAFGEADSFETAGLTDLLQAMIDAGDKITAVVQDRGWMEVHDFEDYRAAIEQYSRGNP